MSTAAGAEEIRPFSQMMMYSAKEKHPRRG